MKDKLFDSEEEANNYKEKHQIVGRVPEYIKGYEKWALVFPLEVHVEVRQPHQNDPSCHLPYFGQVSQNHLIWPGK